MRQLFRVLLQIELRRVIERTNHPRQIFDRRSLQTAFTESAGGFALEVDNVEVRATEQNLTEMVISVNARSHGVHRDILHVAKCAENRGLGREDRFGKSALVAI